MEESETRHLLFTKMHGIGNDYIYIDCTTHTPDNLPELAVSLSDRHKGIGGDGIILILKSKIADFAMRIFNADGSEARMCGNGSRCVGKYVSDKGLTDKDCISLETRSGIRLLQLHKGPDGMVESVTVDMGEPAFDAATVGMRLPSPSDTLIDCDIATLPPSERRLNHIGPGATVTAVSMGNPHAVVFLPPATPHTDAMIATDGAALENHQLWTDRANIEFIAMSDPATLIMRVWERGSGETMACGTGACAAAVAAIATGRSPQRCLTVRLPGGDLTIEWRRADNHVYMTGGATTVFEGSCRLPLAND